MSGGSNGRWRKGCWIAAGMVLAVPVLPLVVPVVVVRSQWRHSRGRLGRMIAVLVIALLMSGAMAGLIWFPVLVLHRRTREMKQRALCGGNVRILTTAAIGYAEDHDGRLPQASSWCDDLLPYVESAEAFQCPSNPKLKSAYAYNAALNGAEVAGVQDGASLILIFESDAGWNAHGGAELLADEPRHSVGEYYGFADGSMTWLPRKQLPDGTWAKEPEAEVRWEVGVAETSQEQ